MLPRHKLVTGSRIPALLSIFITIEAVTIGPLIFTRSASPSDRLVRHELVHVAQYRELWYLGFLPVYTWFWIVGLIKFRSFRNAYMSIPLEQEARFGERTDNYFFQRDRFAWRKYSTGDFGEW